MSELVCHICYLLYKHSSSLRSSRCSTSNPYASRQLFIDKQQQIFIQLRPSHHSSRTSQQELLRAGVYDALPALSLNHVLIGKSPCKWRNPPAAFSFLWTLLAGRFILENIPSSALNLHRLQLFDAPRLPPNLNQVVYGIKFMKS